MPLAWGTEWGKPLKKALELNPKPEVIVFMTDGVAGNYQDAVDKITKTARKQSIVINAVSLLEPKAADGMKQLAEKTGGTAIMVKDAKTIEDLFKGEITKR